MTCETSIAIAPCCHNADKGERCGNDGQPELASDHTTIDALDHDGAVAWNWARCTDEELWEVRHCGTSVSWVLQVDKHCLAVWRGCHSGYFRALYTGKETLEFAGYRVRNE
jgi:hypothetical protein